jgi:hypothetical protein
MVHIQWGSRDPTPSRHTCSSSSSSSSSSSRKSAQVIRQAVEGQAGVVDGADLMRQQKPNTQQTHACSSSGRRHNCLPHLLIWLGASKIKQQSPTAAGTKNGSCCDT